MRVFSFQNCLTNFVPVIVGENHFSYVTGTMRNYFISLSSFPKLWNEFRRNIWEPIKFFQSFPFIHKRKFLRDVRPRSRLIEKPVTRIYETAFQNHFIKASRCSINNLFGFLHFHFKLTEKRDFITIENIQDEFTLDPMSKSNHKSSPPISHWITSRQFFLETFWGWHFFRLNINEASAFFYRSFSQWKFPAF